MTNHEYYTDETAFLRARSPRGLFILNALAATGYFALLVMYFEIGNPFLYAMLLIGQIFYLWQLYTYIFTVWDTDPPEAVRGDVRQMVDIFITVAGEPKEVYEETAIAAMRQTYPYKRVFLLNDGYVAKKEHWQEPIEVAKRLGIECITRTVPGGAKAGNINHALTHTLSPLVAIFDADHVPHPDFLEKTVPYFVDEKMGFVQTPQYYKNHRDNRVTHSAWEQQELFFGPILSGKNRWNAASMCGTNMLVRREALEQVGGMMEESIAEDFVTSVFIHGKGWKSWYHPEILAEGLAPHDLTEYYKQQFRWARGALDIIFRFNPLFRRGLTFAQRIQYLASASFYFTGAIVVIHALLPAAFFFTGLVPIEVPSMLLASVFLPYMFLTLYTIQASSNFRFTFHALAFSMAAFNVHISAIVAALLRRRSAFNITSKIAKGGSHYSVVYPHLTYITLVFVGIGVGLLREGLTPSIVNNAAWSLIHITIFSTFIRAAMPQPAPETQDHPRIASLYHASRRQPAEVS